MQISIEEAVLELNNDGVVAIPTETVYGLAGNAFSENAISKIFEVKKRPLNNPLIVHIGSASDLGRVAREIPGVAYKLSESFWPGPLTLVLKKQESIPQIVTSGLDTVAVRMPNHQLTLELLQKLAFPLAAPSANPFGSISPTSAGHVQNLFKGQSVNILDGGKCERGIESTIVGFDEKEHPVIYRHGAISVEEMEAVIGDLRFSTHEEITPQAPGMLSKHYSPVTTSYFSEDILTTIKSFEKKKIGLLLFKERMINDSVVHQEILSASGNFREAAKNLYAAMHRLDTSKPDVIIFEKLPERDLGLTINDKLRRAAKK